VALIKCPECSRDISDKADTCPQCGFPIAVHLGKINVVWDKQQQMTEPHTTDSVSKKSNSKKINIIIILIVIASLAIASVYGYIKRIEADAANKINITKSLKPYFVNGKAVIGNKHLSSNELTQLKASLELVTPDMTEYNEAKKLIPIVIKMIAEVDKAKEKEEKNQEEAKEKQRRQQEEAMLSPKGKRLRLKHPDWSIKDCDAISKGEITIGMTKAQVIAAWGKPYHVNKSIGSYGTNEQWVMREYGNTYVYFDNGICTSMQGVE